MLAEYQNQYWTDKLEIKQHKLQGTKEEYLDFKSKSLAYAIKKSN
jgi:hypothetical protein